MEKETETMLEFEMDKVKMDCESMTIAHRVYSIFLFL